MDGLTAILGSLSWLVSGLLVGGTILTRVTCAGVTAAANWFAGNNDTGLPMYDDVSGGGFDGLQPEGVNLNQGAESTLALISTRQRARSLTLTGR